MTKRELIAETAHTTGMLRRDTKRVIEAALDQIREALIAGTTVALPGLGTLAACRYSSQPRRHPRTGESVVTRPFYSIHLRTAASLKRRLKDH